MEPTFGDLIDFVLFNKSDKTFIGYSISGIVEKLHKAVNNGTFYYTVNSIGMINGMIIATKHEDTKILFIDENLAMNKINLIKFAKRAKEEFKGYKLEWYKHGIHKMPNTNKVYEKLS
jgi:hypothetical protein